MFILLKISIKSTLIISLSLLFVCCTNKYKDTSIKPSGITHLNKESLYQLHRTQVRPLSSQVEYNCPDFQWPASKNKEVRYRVRLDKDSSFSSENLIQSKKLDWCFFNPHKKLSKGQWYWQYAVIDNKGIYIYGGY